MILHLRSLSDTARFGHLVGARSRPGDLILLFGDLGGGKTTLTQAIARGLEVPDEHYVSSPSFALLHEYHGRLPLYHMDCYRLMGEEDILAAGLDEYLSTSGVTVVEWPERLGTLTPEQRLEITLSTGPGDQERTLVLKGCGGNWPERVAELRSSFVRQQENPL
ncbi:tRNA (adenosine(37)-N6)-threonylcarbamoyltransferase complex ATPase subunit type 1 TsaE [Desulfolithobacter sp.]